VVETWATEALTSDTSVSSTWPTRSTTLRARRSAPGLHPCTPAAFTCTFIAAPTARSPLHLCLLRMVLPEWCAEPGATSLVDTYRPNAPQAR